jgi:hypothetical protein
MVRVQEAVLRGQDVPRVGVGLGESPHSAEQGRRVEVVRARVMVASTSRTRPARSSQACLWMTVLHRASWSVQ